MIKNMCSKLIVPLSEVCYRGRPLDAFDVKNLDRFNGISLQMILCWIQIYRKGMDFKVIREEISSN